MPVALVLVSHVEQLAEGVRELAAQMGPNVPILAAGGTDDGRIGTSFDRVLAAVEAADAASDGVGVIVLYDLGSALMTAELALETLDDERRARIRIVEAPLVEAAVAAATTASHGELADVVRAATEAGTTAHPPEPEAEREPDAEPEPTGRRVTATTVLRNPAGLHARPAARLAHVVGGFDAQVTVGRPGRAGVDATSVLGVVAQGIGVNGEVEVSATGVEARPAVDAVLALVEAGFDELDQPSPEAWVPSTEARPDMPEADEPGVLHGLGAAPGLAVGTARRLRRAEPVLPDRAPDDPAAERRRLAAALDRADAELRSRTRQGGPAGEIAAAHQALLADPELRGRAERAIDDGAAAESAWWNAVQSGRALLAGGGELVADRAADVVDVGLAVLAALGVEVAHGTLPPDAAGTVILAEDLLASDVNAFAEAGVAGLVLARGGPTAHAAIIARGLDLPMVVRLGPGVLDVADDSWLVVDGGTGVVQLDPPASVRFAAKQHAAEVAAEREQARVAAGNTIVVVDGRRITVAANVGSLAEARAAVAAGADGVGLLRTELLYVDRPRLPDEDEQRAELAGLFAAVGERPVTVRTLDAGGDKPVPDLHLDPWRNGPLGERGLRYSLAHPDVLRTQLRAILRAAQGLPVRLGLMAPMVTHVDEVLAFRELVSSTVESLARQGVSYAEPVEVGVMIEVPSAALCASELCEHVDFVSVGSNDLTQYVMAADRTNDAVAGLYRADHSAIWRLLEIVVAGARPYGCKVAVCGELAADPYAARRLVELGVDELSMAPASVPTVKAVLAQG